MLNKIIKEKQKLLHIFIVLCAVFFLLIIAIDNILYNKSEIFNIYESYELSPTIAISEISSSVLNDPTTITIDGTVIKKVNPTIVKKGFFKYSYYYIFNGYISIDDYVFHYDDNNQFISTYLELNNDTVLFASPIQTDNFNIDGKLYKFMITLIRDSDFNILNLKLILYDSENNQKANFVFDF